MCSRKALPSNGARRAALPLELLTYFGDCSVGWKSPELLLSSHKAHSDLHSPPPSLKRTASVRAGFPTARERDSKRLSAALRSQSRARNLRSSNAEANPQYPPTPTLGQ